MDFLFLPFLLGMIASMSLCMHRRARQARPSILIPFLAALLMGSGLVLEAYGFSMFHAHFWHMHAESLAEDVVIPFCLFAFAAFVPALFVVLIYRRCLKSNRTPRSKR